MGKTTVAGLKRETEANFLWTWFALLILIIFALASSISQCSRLDEVEDRTEVLEIGVLEDNPIDTPQAQDPDPTEEVEGEDPEPTETPEHYKWTGEVVCEEHCWHEVAHKYYFENDVNEKDFKDAVVEFLGYWSRAPYVEDRWDDDTDTRYVKAYVHPLMNLIVTFPGFFNYCQEDDGECWGGWVELYASIFEYAQGQRDEIPHELNDLYGYNEMLAYYWQYRPEHFNAEFCAEWAFGQWDEDGSYEYCMVEVRQ